jgi:molybdenum cofactor biosynthesis enzyme MoaA
MTYFANMKTLNGIARQVYMRSHIGNLESFPEEIVLTPTLRCNFNCVTCTQNHKDAREYPESFLKSLDEILPFAKFVNINGGEPLLYKYFDELISIIPGMIAILVVTNGSLSLAMQWRRKLVAGPCKR